MNIGNDNSGRPNDKSRFCAACGGADVLASELAGGDASCNICGWKGTVEELATFHFNHNMGSPEEVFHRFFMDIRKLLGAMAAPIGVVLIKWGFIEQPTAENATVIQKELARYVAGIGKAIAESITKTRADIEKERHRAPAGSAS
jgi:hypothetical protein